ncbi:MAG: hypothetical protein AAF430_08740 [Myxococcota bacterium]
MSGVSRRAALLGLAAFVAVLSLYANASFWVERPAGLRFFPPFLAGVDINANLHLGAENWSIAQALVAGRGFSDPFFVESGPTAWMPPLYPGFLALLLMLTGSPVAVAVLIVLCKNLTLVASGAVVWEWAHRTRRRLPPALALVLFGVWIATHFAWFFQITHDIWWVLLWINGILWGALRLSDQDLSDKEAAGWGLLGGATALSSPIAGASWGALTLFLAVVRRAPRLLVIAALVSATVVSGWVARNALVFGELVLVKSNLAYDLYQANYVSPDGVYDEPFLLRHPVIAARRDANHEYRRLGEPAFIDLYAERFGEAFRAEPGTVASKALNRFKAATLFYKPYRPRYEGNQPPITSLVMALPCVGLLIVLALRRGRLTRLQVCAVVLYGSFLLPYLLAAFYFRYLLPLSPLLTLFVFWALDAVASQQTAAEASADAGASG